MKSKLFKILGVVAIVAMLASTLVAVPASAISGVSVTIGATPANNISALGAYTVYATLATQLNGTSTATWSLPDSGEGMVFTSDVASTATVPSKIQLTVNSPGTLAALGSPTLSAGATYSTSTGIINFTGAGQTAAFVAPANDYSGTYTQSALVATISAGAVVTQFATVTATDGPISLPDIGDNVIITAGGDTTATLPAATAGAYAVTFPAGSGTYTAPTITFNTSTTAVVTATARYTTGSWARMTAGAATAAAGADVDEVFAAGALAASGDTLTLTFPTNTAIASTFVAPTIAASIASSSGWVVKGTAAPAFIASNITQGTSTWSGSTANYTVTLTLGAGDYIGSQAQLWIYHNANITNPSTAGDYSLTFKTSKETTAVTSNTYTIINPPPAVLTGVATVYNSSNIYISASYSLNTALNAIAAYPGGKITLTAGTYTDAAGPYGTPTSSYTIQGVDPTSAANVIIKSTLAWSLIGKTTTIDSVTIDGTTGALTLNNGTTGGAQTISGSYLTKGALTVVATGTTTTTLRNDTFTVANSATGLIANASATVTGCTFNITGSGTGISANFPVTVSGSMFVGAAATGTTSPTGTGIALNNTSAALASSTIGTSTFTGLSPALSVANGTGFGTAVSFNGNTVQACGITGGAAGSITVLSTTANPAGVGVAILNNTITNSLSYIINVAANDNLVNVMNNTFAGNVKNGFTTANVAGALNMTHNYWSGAAVPASVTTGTQQISYANPLGAAPSVTGSNFLPGSALDATATAGVNIVVIGGTVGATVVGAAALPSNPVTPTLPPTVTVVKYYDVYGLGAPTGIVTLRFMGTTANPITSGPTGSAVYYYNTINGTWTDMSTITGATVSANVFANYVEVTFTLGAVGGPTAAQISGLPFALVTKNPVAPGVVAQGTVAPATATTNVSVTPSFGWTAIGSSTYEFNLSTDSTFVAANFFSATPTTNGVIVSKTLAYNTVYYWQVRSVDPATGLKSAWTTGFFTTMLAPVPVVTPAFGATAVSILPNITWPAVTGAVSYNFNLSTETTFAAAKVFYTGTSTTNGIAIPKILAWNTTYNWEFQSVDAAGNKSAWTTSFFTTAPQATPTLKPALGAQGVSLTPTFTWDPIPGAVSYEFALAQEIGAVNKFDILDYSNNTPTPGITAQETLLYSTTYNWEYRAVDSTGAKSAWTVSFFTTMDKPAAVTTTASTAVVTTQPTIIITQPTVTQTPITIISTTGTPASPAIPSYLLWAVIAVGAVLVIAVIVLIVRTRRIP